MSIISIIQSVVHGVETEWSKIEADINADVGRIKAAWPGAASTIDAVASDVKQGASNAIDFVETAIADTAPAFTKTVEGAADAALAAYTGGLALPLTGLTNDGIEKIVGLAVSTAQAWGLKAKASLAENNATTSAAKTA